MLDDRWDRFFRIASALLLVVTLAYVLSPMPKAIINFALSRAKHLAISSDHEIRKGSENPIFSTIVHSATLDTSAEALTIAWSWDSHLIATSTYNYKNVTIWDVSSHKIVQRLDRIVVGGDSLEFTSDNKSIITSTARNNPHEDPDTAVAVWNIDSGKVSAVLPGPNAGRGINENLADAFALDRVSGSLAVVYHGARRGLVGIYDKNYKIQRTLTTPDELGFPVRVDFSPDGRLLAIGTISGKIGLYDTGNWSLLREITAYGKLVPIPSMAFSPDSSSLATAPRAAFGGAIQGSIRIWNVGTGGLQRTLDLTLGGSSLGVITGLAWSPDANFIASAGNDRIARLWDVAGTNAPLVVHQFRHSAWSVSFSPDGRRLAASGDEGVLLFDLVR